jgi:hypothetical protein
LWDRSWEPGYVVGLSGGLNGERFIGPLEMGLRGYRSSSKRDRNGTLRSASPVPSPTVLSQRAAASSAHLPYTQNQLGPHSEKFLEALP